MGRLSNFALAHVYRVSYVDAMRGRKITEAIYAPSYAFLTQTITALFYRLHAHVWIPYGIDTIWHGGKLTHISESWHLFTVNVNSGCQVLFFRVKKSKFHQPNASLILPKTAYPKAFENVSFRLHQVYPITLLILISMRLQ